MGICASREEAQVLPDVKVKVRAKVKREAVAPKSKTRIEDFFIGMENDFAYDQKSGILKCNANLNLLEFHTMLREKKLFLPQELFKSQFLSQNFIAIGDGQLGRSHGVFAKYIRGYGVSLSRGQNKSDDPVVVWKPGIDDDIYRVEDNDYFYKNATAGYMDDIGEITHIYVKPLKDEDYPKSRGMKLIAPYSSTKLQNCLQIMAEMSDNDDFPRDFDYRVTVLTDVKNFWYKKSLLKGLDDEKPVVVDDEPEPVPMPVIVVYVQWANVEGVSQEFGKHESGYFRTIRRALGRDFIDAYLCDENELSHMNHDIARLVNKNLRTDEKVLDFSTPTPMSELTKYWIYDDIREYVMPHENRTYKSAATNLSTNGWSEKISACITNIVSGEVSGLKAVVQFQAFGGRNSMYDKNCENSTTSIVQRFDSFYVDGDGSEAKVWEAQALSGLGFNRIADKSGLASSNPSTVSDLISLLKQASRNEISVGYTVRGKRYNGISSSSNTRFEIDLNTCLSESEYDESSELFEFGAGFAPIDLNKSLREYGLFIPQGMSTVHSIVGDHFSDNYDQIARSHGTFSDYIEGYKLVMSKGGKSDQPITVTVWKPGSKYPTDKNLTKRDSDQMFHNIATGKLQNIGILTHIYINPLKDEDYPKSRGMKLIAPYSSTKLQNCLQIMAEMSDNDDFPRDFDYRVTVLTDVKNFWYKKSLLKGLDDEKPVVVDDEPEPVPMPVIVVYVQWANVEGVSQEFGKHESGYFRTIRRALGRDFIDAYLCDENELSHMNHDIARLVNKNLRTDEKVLDFSTPTPMSELTKYWIYDDIREYVMPHENRTYKSAATNLSTNGWPEWITRRTDMIVSGEVPDMKAVVQFQAFGGRNSMYDKIDKSRKTQIVQSFDCFSSHANRKRVGVWKSNNDKEAPTYGFSKM